MVLDKENDGGGKYKLRSNEANFTVILVVKFASFDRVYTSSSRTPMKESDPHQNRNSLKTNEV